MDKSDFSDEEFERLAILELQSSDAESSTDDDAPISEKKTYQDPSPEKAAVWKTVVNIVNYIEGVGFLALPYAVKLGGIVTIVAFFIIPVCLWYTGTVLVDCLYDTDNKQKKVKARSTFKDLGEVLLPKYGGYLVTTLVQVDLYVASVSYLILCGSLMNHALPSVPLTVTAWTCLAGVVVLPTTFLKSLSKIAWLSTLSVVALISILISVLWYGTEHIDEWNPETLLFWDTEGVSIAFPILIYGYGAVNIIPSVQDSMQEKQKFPRALFLANIVNMVIKVSFSLFGFFSFGSSTDQVILNNLPAGPFHISISVIFILSCILSFPLPLHPVLVLIEETEVIKIIHSRIPILGSILIRVIMVLSSVIVAIIVPKFALIISFTGSIITSFCAYIFPSAVHLKLKFNQLKRHQVCIDVLMILIGFFALIFGVIFSGKALILG